MSDFHKKLIALREECRITQEDFANDLEVSRTAVSSWERGKSVPTKKNIQRICEYFGVSPDYFYGAPVDGAKSARRAKKQRVYQKIVRTFCYSFVGMIALYHGYILLHALIQKWDMPDIEIGKQAFAASWVYLIVCFVFGILLVRYCFLRWRKGKSIIEGENRVLVDFSDKIANLRKERGLAQHEVAAALGVSRRMVSLWEQGKNFPSENNVQKVCKYFGVSPDYFYTACDEDGRQKEKDPQRGKKVFFFSAAGLFGAYTLFWLSIFWILCFLSVSQFLAGAKSVVICCLTGMDIFCACLFFLLLATTAFSCRWRKIACVI